MNIIRHIIRDNRDTIILLLLSNVAQMRAAFPNFIDKASVSRRFTGFPLQYLIIGFVWKPLR